MALVDELGGLFDDEVGRKYCSRVELLCSKEGGELRP